MMEVDIILCYDEPEPPARKKTRKHVLTDIDFLDEDELNERPFYYQ